MKNSLFASWQGRRLHAVGGSPIRRWVVWLLVWLPLAAAARPASSSIGDERIYLSGRGSDDPVAWDFYCTAGRRSGSWQRIGVPSQWEQEGFGTYCYGRWYKEGPAEPPREEGIYRRTFEVPAAWRGRRVRLVFEGVMTDAEVTVNGRSAGPVHRGAFYEFDYDVTPLLCFGAENRIEVRVAKESADRSVNRAERMADWWLFGGIFRPVYLEAGPRTRLLDAALDPQADGSLTALLGTTPLPKGCSLELTLEDRPSVVRPLGAGGEHRIACRWEGIEPWHPEHPRLYRLTMTLRDGGGRLLHRLTERIGFRTVELRPADGLYLNGRKLLLKGINRHSFHPASGRTTSAAISRRDGELIRAMNCNAVRVHYAPDRHFLDVCDSLGLVVVDEFCGWQRAYSTEAGSPLVEAFVRRDRNRPSVILWSNGNEGGWNTELDGRFAELDPQRRPLIHPWADFGAIDTHHYPAFLTGVGRFVDGRKLFMPTEFMHGMYDQGHGAGLEDFWNRYTASPLFVGGFLWDFSDNAVERRDRGGALDSDGSNAADGILGPYREREASFYAVRDIWAPVQFAPLRITRSFDGRLLVRNDYLETDLAACTARYRLLRADPPAACRTAAPVSYAEGFDPASAMRVAGEGPVRLPALEPRCSGYARMELPDRFFDADVLEITVFDPSGRAVTSATWPIRRAADLLPQPRSGGRAEATADSLRITLHGGGVAVSFRRSDGRIESVRNARGPVSFGDGPIPVGMRARLLGSECRTEGDRAVVTCRYAGAIDSIRWEMSADGVLAMDAVVLNRAKGGEGFDDAVTDADIAQFGFSFRYPESLVRGVRWFGRGPYRVWKNRIRGTQYGVWEKAWNDTSTGAGEAPPIYPEFKGYHADMRWMTLRTDEGDWTVYSADEGVFFRLYTPADPVGNKSGIAAYPAFPEGDLSFLLEIPAIRDFKPIADHGPRSQPGQVRIKRGDEGLRIRLRFDFRPQ